MLFVFIVFNFRRLCAGIYAIQICNLDKCVFMYRMRLICSIKMPNVQDPTISDIEKFISGSDYMSPVITPSTPKKGCDTQDLLSILDTNSPMRSSKDLKLEKRKIDVEPTDRSKKLKQHHRRKSNEKRQKTCEIEEKRKHKTKTATKSNLSVKRPKIDDRKLKINGKKKMANIGIIGSEKCKRLYMKRPMKANIVIEPVPENGLTATVSAVKSCTTESVRNIVVKTEVIDLTDDNNNRFPMTENFATICDVEEVTYETAEPLMQNAKVCEFELNTALCYTPDVRYDVIKSAVDLTNCHEQPLTVISENECINMVLPILYKFHKINLFIKAMQGALEEIQACLSETEAKTTVHLAEQLKSNITSEIGHTLIRTLSSFFLKNVNISRFLKVCTVKLNQQYPVVVNVDMLSRYLQIMLNEDSCKSHLPVKLKKEVDAFRSTLIVKTEAVGDVTDNDSVEQPQVFTEPQLQQLREQILQYHQIAGRQKELVRSLEDAEVRCFALSRVLDSTREEKQMKEELLLLAYLEQGIRHVSVKQNDVDVIIELDD